MGLTISVSNTGNLAANNFSLTYTLSLASGSGAKLPGYLGPDAKTKPYSIICTPDYLNDAQNLTTATFTCTGSVAAGATAVSSVVSGSLIAANNKGATLSASTTISGLGLPTKTANASVVVS